MIDVNQADIAEMSVKAVKNRAIGFSVEVYPELCAILDQDKRVAVKNLSKSLLNQYLKHQKLIEKLSRMKVIENKCYAEGYHAICGIDEVGRGPLAGPVVCAAVIMPADSRILKVDDSKKLSAKMRETLNERILKEAVAVEFGLKTPEEIDQMNILNATKNAMENAVNAMKVVPDLLLIDAVTINTKVETRAIIHGDAVCYSIAAASIVAKVYRDKLMKKYHEQYPEYGFDRNMGYGTAEHIAAIKAHGITPIHRLSFVKNFI
ncbi:MAG: ribonuclease HII [Eubacterium sp.]